MTVFLWIHEELQTIVRKNEDFNLSDNQAIIERKK